MVRVLLVEDNRYFRETIKANLSDRFPSLSIDEAEDAEEALKKINSAPPHVIFTDIRLPGMNGFDLTQKIKKDFPNIRINILSAHDAPEYRQASAQYGAEGFFVKESLNWGELEALFKSIA